jgi:hypothetical protein
METPWKVLSLPGDENFSWQVKIIFKGEVLHMKDESVVQRRPQNAETQRVPGLHQAHTL